MKKYFLYVTCFVFLAGFYTAHSNACELHNRLSFDDLRVRATATAMSTAAFVNINNLKQEAILIEARSDVADRVELHTHIIEDGIAKMREVESITLPAGEVVQLKPRDLHIMLMQLEKPLKEGEEVTITLVVRYPESKEEVEHKLTFPVVDMKRGK